MTEVNQIAKRINQTGCIYSDGMDELRRLMEETVAIGKATAPAIQGAYKMRVWETSQGSAPAGEACEGTSVLQGRIQNRLSCSYACYETLNLNFKGNKWNKNLQNKSEHLPKCGNLLSEPVYYKIGGTILEIETSCSGSELLHNKMERLIKSETVTSPADMKKKVRYNKDSNQFVGRLLQEE